MKNIKKYIEDRGYGCAPGLTENYCLSLMCRPFVILTGLSHMDMTRLPELVANAMGATCENGRYKCVKVEYDWMDFFQRKTSLNLFNVRRYESKADWRRILPDRWQAACAYIGIKAKVDGR